MTEPLTPLTDEDLSAVLDGVADASVVARVDADPAASARLAQLRSVSDRLRTATATPLAPSVVDDLIGRALAAAGQVPAGDGAVDHGPADDGVVQSMVAPTRRRSGATPPWLVAAAIVLLVGVGLVLVWSGRDRDSQDRDTVAVNTEQTSGGGGTEKAANSSDGSAAGGVPGAAPSVSAPHGVPTTAGSASEEVTRLSVLGTFAGADALREGLKDSFPRSSDQPATGGDLEQQGLTEASISRCDTQVRTILAIEGQALERGVATVGGRQVLVYEYGTTTADGKATTLVAAVYPAACDQVLTFIR